VCKKTARTELKGGRGTRAATRGHCAPDYQCLQRVRGLKEGRQALLLDRVHRALDPRDGLVQGLQPVDQLSGTVVDGAEVLLGVGLQRDDGLRERLDVRHDTTGQPPAA